MASADTADVTLYPGFNMIAASLVPYDPSPSAVFKTDTGAAIPITSSRLMRWDSSSSPQQYKYYTPAGGGAQFGKVLLGMGMFYKADAGSNIFMEYVGVPNGVPDSSNKKTDMWISLAFAGYNQIGSPFTDAVTWANCLMTDGNTTQSVSAAKTAGWWSGNLQWWDAQASPQQYKNVNLTPVGTRTLQGYTGYFLKTSIPNLALIVPANTP
jgi:hypothetical protein